MKITSLLENLLEGERLHDYAHTIQSTQGDIFHVYQNGEIEDEYEHVTYSNAIFIPKDKIEQFKQLDGMIKHFGGFGKVKIVASGNLIGFQYYSEKDKSWKPVNRVTDGKEHRFTLPFSKVASKENSLMLVFGQGRDGVLNKWKVVGYIQSPVGGDYGRSTPYSDPKNKW
jgi:hypothetical protein